MDPIERAGLALRRVAWQANGLNVVSTDVAPFVVSTTNLIIASFLRSAAERIGFTFEGRLRSLKSADPRPKRPCVGTERWHRVLAPSKAGITVPHDSIYGTPEAGPGRDSFLLSVTWHDWKTTVRDRVADLMSRQIRSQSDASQFVR